MKLSTREQRIIDLAKDGLSPAEIHTLVGGSKNGIHVLLSRARKTGDAPPSTKDPQVRVPMSVYSVFVDEADKRSLNAEDLIRCVLDLVACDNLFSAVLDK